MRIGILGSGIVGQTLGAKLLELGHDVVLGTRRPGDFDDARGLGRPLREWLDQVGPGGRIATFPETAEHGELVLNAIAGTAALDALREAGVDNLRGKILIDISNPLDFSNGFPPSLTVCNNDSLGEQIQRTYPATRVVKALNTVTAALMVAPDSIGDGDHGLFISGDDDDAKAHVTGWLQEWFGWREIVDLGDITTARGTEMILPLWSHLMGSLGTPMFNFKIVR